MAKHYDICELYDVLMLLTRVEAGALLQAVALYRRTHTIMQDLPRNVEQLLGGEIVKIRAAEDHCARVSIARRESIKKRWKNTNEYKCIQMNTNVKNNPPLSTPIYNPPDLPPKGERYTPKGVLIDDLTDKNQSKVRKKFSPPSVEEVREYCRERNNRINPEAFVDHYASKGWLVGKTPMKEWKAAVRNWERRETAEVGNSPKQDGGELFNQFGARKLC